jgi:Transferase family
MLFDSTLLDLPFARGGPLESEPTFGFVVDGQLDPVELKSALNVVFDHFPVLGARLAPNGADLFLPQETPLEKFGWQVENRQAIPLGDVFTIPRTHSDCIAFLSSDPRSRAAFYVPESTRLVDNLVHFHLQLFLDKTIIGLTWNHFLTDACGICTILKLWSNALDGEMLPQSPFFRDPVLPHYTANPTTPPFIVPLSTWKRVHTKYRLRYERLVYGPPEPRSIFIPRNVLATWKESAPDVSTNDLITAWVLKAWASSTGFSLVSVFTIADWRRRLPNIIPPGYLRNAVSGRLPSHPLQVQDLNAMSLSDVARKIRCFVQSVTPAFEINCQSYEHSHRRDGLIMVPETPTFALSSFGNIFYSKEIFGGNTNFFDCLVRTKNPKGDRGTVWVDQDGATVTFWMSKRRWEKGVWANVPRTAN